MNDIFFPTVRDACIELEKTLVNEALTQDTYKSAMKFLDAKKHDFSGSFGASINEQIYGLYNSAIEEAKTEIRKRAYQQEIKF